MLNKDWQWTPIRHQFSYSYKIYKICVDVLFSHWDDEKKEMEIVFVSVISSHVIKYSLINFVFSPHCVSAFTALLLVSPGS